MMAIRLHKDYCRTENNIILIAYHY